MRYHRQACDMWGYNYDINNSQLGMDCCRFFFMRLWYSENNGGQKKAEI